MNQDEIDQILTQAKATLPKSPLQREIDAAIAKWDRDHPSIGEHFKKPECGAV